MTTSTKGKSSGQFNQTVETTLSFRDERNVLTTVAGQLVLPTNHFIADPATLRTTPRLRGNAALTPVPLAVRAMTARQSYEGSHADKIISGIAALFG